MIEHLDLNEIARTKKEAHRDSWWLGLFLPKAITSTFSVPENVGYDEMQPLLLGETLIASNSVIAAWCPWDDKCPWYIEPLKRVSSRASSIRQVVALTMQAERSVKRGDYYPAGLLCTVLNYSELLCEIDGVKFNRSYVQLIHGLPHSEVASGEIVNGGDPVPGLFFRWGQNGGGFLLPVVDAG